VWSGNHRHDGAEANDARCGQVLRRANRSALIMKYERNEKIKRIELVCLVDAAILAQNVKTEKNSKKGNH
jgi:hypothetical protein|tara:strand:- start:296 stop:505 length:210 start_codon:yes stop_codon:yes gene_type:complete